MVRALGIKRRPVYLPQQQAPPVQQAAPGAQQSFAAGRALEKPVAASAARATRTRTIREFFMGMILKV